MGGNATPPPVNCGARIVPARARPVPFWRHGFERPPATKPRLFAAWVPARRAFSSARAVSWTRCGLMSTANTDASSVRSFDFLPVTSSTGALGAATTLVLSDLDDAVLRAGDGALDQQQIPLDVDLVHGQADLRAALTTQSAGHLLALEHARRGG